MSVPAIIRWDQAYNRNGDGKLPRAVLNALRGYMDNDTLSGWVSQETLARDTGLDESNVRRQIRRNADAGWLVVTKRGRAGRASEYRLTYPEPGADARLPADGAEAPTVQIRTVNHPDPNRANLPGYTLQPGANARLLPGEYARPTTPGTSPQEKFSRESTVEVRTETGPDSDPWGSASQPATAIAGATEAPEARTERATRTPQPATAGGPSASPWD
jgi:hypothetical protein